MEKSRSIAILIILFSFSLPGFSQTNTFPSSGNVGIGTTSPAGPLDVHSAYYTGGYKFMDNYQPNSSVGFLNPIALGVRQGRIQYPDEEFSNGNNGIAIYDNNSSGQIAINRLNTISDVPNSTGYGVEIIHNGSGESPGYGGFYQSYTGGTNKTIVQVFRAKLPAGYYFNPASNSLGAGGSEYWLSNNAGTGKWEWYIRVTQYGSAGPFANAGYIFITGSPAPTSSAPLVWYLASCTAFDVTNVNFLQGNYLANQNGYDQNASFRITGNGIIEGNLLVGKTSQTNNAYKIDINGNLRANAVVVNTTGADFVFDSSYRLPSLSVVENYISKNKHLPDIASAKQMQSNGVDLGENQIQLLRKVEELTIYAIQQNKKNEEQDKIIVKLIQTNRQLEQQLARLNNELIQLKGIK